MTQQLQRNSAKTRTAGLILALTLMFALQVSTAIAGAIALPAQTVAPGEVKLTVNIVLPPGHKLNPEAPSTVSITAGDSKIFGLDAKYANKFPAANLPLCLTVPVTAGQTSLQAIFHLNYCDDKIGLCFFKEDEVTLPVEVKKGAAGKALELVHQVKTR